MAHFQVIVAKIIFNVIILLVTTNFNLRIRVIIRARFIAPLHFFYLGRFKCLNKYLPILHTLLVSYLFPITFRFQRAALNAPRGIVNNYWNIYIFRLQNWAFDFYCANRLTERYNIPSCDILLPAPLHFGVIPRRRILCNSLCARLCDLSSLRCKTNVLIA